MIKNFRRYAELTECRDWKAICALNGVPFDSIATRKELLALPDHLEEGETVLALCSGMATGGFQDNAAARAVDSWVVALTDRRFLFLDCALLSHSVGTQTIRHADVLSVAAAQGWVLGKIMINLEAQLVVVDNCIRQSVTAMADLAEQVLRAAPRCPVSDALLDQLERLARLRSTGALDEARFRIARAQVMAAA